MMEALSWFVYYYRMIYEKYIKATPMLRLKPNFTLRWRHNWHDGVSNDQPHDCLLNPLFRRRLKKTSKLRASALCVGNSPVTSEFPAQMASNAENVSIWWRHHEWSTSPCWYITRSALIMPINSCHHEMISVSLWTNMCENIALYLGFITHWYLI